MGEVLGFFGVFWGDRGSRVGVKDFTDLGLFCLLHLSEGFLEVIF